VEGRRQFKGLGGGFMAGAGPSNERASRSMARVSPGEFLRQVRSESAKIVWPTRRETMMTGLMVVIMTSLLAIFFFGVDSAFSAIVHFLLGLLS
jgi:preprotein translocase subunit SecE